MKREPVDYTKLSAYDPAYLSGEDYKLYGKYLQSLPYDPELMRFFHEQKRYLDHCRYISRRFSLCPHRKRKHGLFIGYMETGEDLPDNSKNPERLVIREESRREFMQAFNTLPEIHKTRFFTYMVRHVPIWKIARKQHVSASAVSHSVHVVKKLICEFFANRV